MLKSYVSSKQNVVTVNSEKGRILLIIPCLSWSVYNKEYQNNKKFVTSVVLILASKQPQKWDIEKEKNWLL